MVLGCYSRTLPLEVHSRRGDPIPLYQDQDTPTSAPYQAIPARFTTLLEAHYRRTRALFVNIKSILSAESVAHITPGDVAAGESASVDVAMPRRCA